MSSIGGRLRDAAGDTMVEVLAAILIAALGASLLATMVMAASNVTITNESTLSRLHTAESALASGGVAGQDVQVTIQIGSTSASVPIVLVQNGEFALYRIP